MTTPTYGFIGVGRMGMAMTLRLLAQGADMWIYDPDARAMDTLVAAGAKRAVSARHVADEAPVVFLSLPSPAAAFHATFGEQGIAHGISARQVVDFSTIGSKAAIKVSAALRQRDMTYIDAPVSGGVAGAHAGTLTIMVSCPATAFADIEPLLKTFGRAFHVGESAGQAQTLKLANNLLSATAIAISSEALVMGVKAGLDPRRMLEVINAGSGRNSATQDKFPRAVLTGSFDYGFGTGLSYKDLRLCIDEAESLGVPMPVGSAVREMLAITQAMFGAESDYTSVCRVVESWAGAQVRDATPQEPI